MLKFKYLRYVGDESGADGAECLWKVASVIQIAGVIRSLVNIRSLQVCVRRCYVLIYGSETIVWKGKESFRTKVVQMEYLSGFF